MTGAATAGAPSSGGLEGKEETAAEPTGPLAVTSVAQALTPDGSFEMVLVPPEDAPVLVIQRVVRGMLSRQMIMSLKVKQGSTRPTIQVPKAD